jgi:hypothetical protein
MKSAGVFSNRGERSMIIEDDNPYTAPKAEVLGQDQHFESSCDAWRDGEVLVVRKGAELTDRCLKCAAPTDSPRDRYSQTLSWHKPIWALTFLISPVVYALIFFAVRWRGKVTVSLCHQHRRKRKQFIGLGLLAGLPGIGAIGLGLLSKPHPPVALSAGILLLFVGLFVTALGSQVLVTTRIDKHLIWLGRVPAEYLAKLPDWNP